MKIIPFSELYYTEFVLSDPIAMPQNWFTPPSFYDCRNQPKTSHTFLWLKNCTGRIEDRNGIILNAQKNQLVYMAKGSQYLIQFEDTAPDRVDSVVIHFQMTTKEGEEIVPSGKPMLCISSVDPSLGMALDMLAGEFKNNVVCIPEVKSVIYRIFAQICQSSHRAAVHSKFSCIRDGIELLEKNSDLGISEIARICGVSECYFRRLFREYSGDSPMGFRQKHRIEKAKQLLLSDEHLTVGEVAAELHFDNIYHFSKTFRSVTGFSPTGFVRQYRE